jgi:two-component system OmpR family response regulator
MAIRRILVVDDDPDVCTMLKQYLTREGYAVEIAQTTQAAMSVVDNRRVDLVFLDVMLGEESGFDVCQKLRQDNDVPIIFLSALSADHHRMTGYQMGGDDYIAKPFNPGLLLARVRAVFRRTHRASSLAYRRDTRTYRFDRWCFLGDKEELHDAEGVEVALSKRETSLIKVLLANAQIPLTREEISSALNDEDHDEVVELDAQQSRAIDVLVGRLRQKIEQNPKAPKLIKTVRGTGYQLCTTVRVDG